MPYNPVRSITIFNMEMNFQKLTNVPGGFRDLRPSDIGNITGVPDNQVFLQNVENVSITALNVRAYFCFAMQHLYRLAAAQDCWPN